VTVLDGQLATGVKIVVFDAPELFDRPGVFGPDRDSVHPDNAQRFGLLCHAAAALVEQRASHGQPFDVVHLHNYPAAPAAAILKAAATTVLTVHDARSPGIFDSAEVESGPIGEAGQVGERVSFLKAGAVSCDALTTLSPTYAADIQTAEHGGELAQVFRERAEVLTGIVSGLDYAAYNPATDPALKNRYHAEDTSNKGSCRTEAIRAHELELEVDRPLIVALLSDDSAAERVAAVLREVMKNDLSLIVAPVGRTRNLEPVSAAAEQFPGVVRVASGVDDPGVRRLCAGADLLWLPAPYDASGFLARVAQRYGALPVAPAAGAHRDVLVDCDSALETGTAFVYPADGGDAAAGALERGLSAYRSPRWFALRRRVMRLDLGWERPARRYVQVYRRALAQRAR
jgi:starch synthase